MANETLFPKLGQLLESLQDAAISADRHPILNQLVDYIQSKVDAGDPVRLNFICTHNSRRSHLSQLWAQAAAEYYGVPGVACYSGGTETTALYPAAAQTLIADGFQMEVLAACSNPVYVIKFGPDSLPVIGFSKKFEDSFNPSSGFAAVMTCSQADEGCPFVPGSERRIALTYEDPKAFDSTPQQMEKYRERSRQIAAEMVYVFSRIKAGK